MSIRLSIENYKIFMLTNWKMYGKIKYNKNQAVGAIL